MNDINVLRMWIRVFTIGAAICTTCVPVLYAFYPWRTRLLGRLFMFQAISFAVALDFSAVISIWRPKQILVIFYADLVVLALIALSTLSLAIQMWRINRPKKKEGHLRVVHK